MDHVSQFLNAIFNLKLRRHDPQNFENTKKQFLRNEKKKMKKNKVNGSEMKEVCILKERKKYFFAVFMFENLLFTHHTTKA